MSEVTLSSRTQSAVGVGTATRQRRATASADSALLVPADYEKIPTEKSANAHSGR